MIPQDPRILLSFINTKLRDGKMNFKELCEELQDNKEAISTVLAAIDYHYSSQQNQFI